MVVLLLGFFLGFVGTDVNDFDSLLTVVLGAAFGEGSFGIEIVLEEGAAGGLVSVDQWATVAHLLR